MSLVFAYFWCFFLASMVFKFSHAIISLLLETASGHDTSKLEARDMVDPRRPQGTTPRGRGVGREGALRYYTSRPRAGRPRGTTPRGRGRAVLEAGGRAEQPRDTTPRGQRAGATSGQDALSQGAGRAASGRGVGQATLRHGASRLEGRVGASSRRSALKLVGRVGAFSFV
uniref:Uncharacterized protein n=1 Tax=Solanum lycopersicum TaxID=4081 RepID=A0A3Q7HKE1_SOLLC